MERRNRSCQKSGNRRHPLLGVALVLVCGISSVIAPPAAQAWGKKKSGKNSTAAPSAEKISAVAVKLLQKARTLREKGKNEQSIETYKQALQIDSTLVDAWLELAALYSDVNIPEKAAEMFETGLPLAEQLDYEPAALALLWCQSAELHVQLGKLDLAAGDLMRATALAPEKALPHKISGDISLAKQNLDDAFRSYHEAVTLEPAYGDAWFAMGSLALEAKRAKEAQIAYNGLLEADTGRAEQFGELMRQAHLKPVVMPKTALAKPATAVSDDPYAGFPVPPVSEQPEKKIPESHKPSNTGFPRNLARGVPSADAGTTASPAVPPMPKPASSPSSAGEPVASAAKSVQAPVPAAASDATPLSATLLQAMVEQLFDEDPAIVDKACEELALYADQSLPVIRERLSEPDPEHRTRLIRALGGMKKASPQVIPLLEESALDPDPGVQIAAEEALKKLKN